MTLHTSMYNNSVTSPEPDLNSGMAGLQMAISTRETFSGKGTPATGTTPRAKPSIPQKKTHIDELLRLRKELEEMREARDQAYGERDAMADDVLKAQEGVEEKDEELSKMSREVWTWRDKAEKLSNDMADERRPAAQGRRSLVGGNARSPVTREANGRNEAELAQARQQVQQLTAALAESDALLNAKTSTVHAPEVDQQASTQEAQRQFQAQLAQAEDHWRSQALEQQKLRQAAEGGLHDTREYYENKLRDVESQARSQIEEQQRRLQETETGLQGRMEVDSGGNEELERLRRLAAEQEGRVDDQRQCAEQFRRMSERLTTQVKQANLAKRGLEHSEQAMRQQVEDMRSQITAWPRQQNNNNMPGSFQRY